MGEQATEGNSLSVVARVDVGGYCLAVSCSGQGSPTVVLDAGLGEGKARWAAEMAALEQFARVCGYARAGVGDSDPGPRPRTSRRMVEELRALLRVVGIAPPYMLAGHSLGGLNMQLFAELYLAEVAGLVLVDPTFPAFPAQVNAQLGPAADMVWATMFGQEAKGMTLDDLLTSCAEVAAAGPLPDVPSIVLCAGQAVQLPAEYAQLQAITDATLSIMSSGHSALAASSAQGELRIDAESLHGQFRPEPVVTAIRDVIPAYQRTR